MGLPLVGLQAAIANLPGFEAGAKAINNAYDAIEKKAGNVEKATGRLSSTFSSLGSPLAALGGQFVGLGDSLLKVGTIAGGAALAGVVALGGGLAALTVSSIGQAKDLDQQLANIAATMGVTKDAVGPLKDEILRLSLDPTLTVNVTQAADAIQLLGQNGLTTSQILDGAAQSTVAMANATGADFPTAANIATGAMQAFNLQASDLSTVADGITGVLVTSKFNANDYALALANAGEIANSSGVSLSDFNTIIASTASSFSSGSDAGTSLKTLLQRFANPTDEAQKAMSDLGISVFDSGGNMRDMKDIVGDLNKAFAGMTDKQRAQTAAVIGGTDASRTLLALSGMTSDQFAELSVTVNRSGQASQAASTRVDSLSGAWEILQGIIQGIQIQVGDLFLPILQQMTGTLAELSTNIGPAVVSFFAGLIAKGQELFTAFQKFGAGGLLASLGLEGGALLFKKVSELMTLIMGDSTTLADTLTNTLGAAITFLSTNLLPALTVGVQFVIDHFEEIKGALLGVGAVLAGGVFAAIVAGIVSLVSPIMLVVAGAALLGAAWAGNWGGIQDKTMAAWAVIQPILADIGTWLGTNIPVAVQFMSDTITTLAAIWTGTLLPAMTSIWSFISTYLSPIFDNLSQRADLVIFTFNKFGTEAGFAMFGKQVVGVINQMIPGFSGLVAWLQVNIPAAIATVTTFWNTTLLPALQGIGTFITGTLIPAFTNVATFLTTVMSVAIQTVANMWTNDFMPPVTAVWGFISNSLLPLFASVSDVINAVFGVAITALAGVFQNILMPALRIAWDYFSTKILTQFNLVAGVVNTVLGVAITGLSKIWSDTLLPAIRNVGGFIEATLNPAMAAVGVVITDKVSPPISLLSDKIFPALQKAFDGIVRAIKEATGYFHGLADAVRNFSLPAILTPGSPTPLEVALVGIGNAANMAGNALANMSGSLAGSISSTQIDQLLGLNRHMAELPSLIDAASNATEHFWNDRKDKIDKAKSGAARRAMSAVFEQHKDEILGATGKGAAVKLFADLTAAAGFNAEKIGLTGKQFNQGLGEFIGAFKQAEVDLKDAQQRAFIQAGRTAVGIGNSLNEIIKGSANVLDTRVETLQALVNSGLSEVNFEGTIISATDAQEKLNQALLEQKSIQDDLLQTQQNQAKLDFLNKQLDLLDTIKKAGLDPTEILGGLQLGLDASIPDIIAATNRLVQAMVDQVNKDLQIGSPSKVMFGKGKDTGIGFGLGMLRSIPDVMRATQQMISAVPAMVNAPALGGGGGAQNVSNTNFNMTVNTGATPQAVVGQYAIMQAMVG